MPIYGDLRIFSRKAEEFTIAATGEVVKARKAFAVQRDSKSKTAENWAKAIPWLAPQLDRLQILFEEDADIYEDVPNTPMKNLRLVSIEYRNRGGRAYKVVTEDGYIYDFREDPLVDVITTVGIRPGGYLNGEYVWASGPRLIRVGSNEYKQHVEASQRKKADKISNKDLVPGCIYEMESGQKVVFWGWVHSDEAPRRKKGLWSDYNPQTRVWNGRGYDEVEINDADTIGSAPATFRGVDYNYRGLSRPEMKGSCRVAAKVAGPFAVNGDMCEALRASGAQGLIRCYNNYVANHQRYSSRRYPWDRTPASALQTRTSWWNDQGGKYSDRWRATVQWRDQDIVYPEALDVFRDEERGGVARAIRSS